MTDMITEAEIPENIIPFTIYYMRSPADAVGQQIISAAGHHMKCRLVRAVLIPLVVG